MSGLFIKILCSIDILSMYVVNTNKNKIYKKSYILKIKYSFFFVPFLYLRHKAYIVVEISLWQLFGFS